MGYVAVLLMGLVMGALGGGGGILTVPILVGFFGKTPEAATGASLLVVGLAASVGAFTGIRRKESEVGAAISLAIPSSIGAFAARVFVLPAIPPVIAGVERGKWLLGTFAVLMLIVGIRMLKPTPEAAPDAPKKPWWLVGIIGLAIGVVSGTLGAGGGFLILPALTVLLGIELKRAIPTSLIVIMLQSLVGFSGELSKPIEWSVLLPIVGVAMVGMVAGLAVRERVPKAQLQRAFAVLVFAVAAWIVWRVIGG
jgi:uncharacterized protein